MESLQYVSSCAQFFLAQLIRRPIPDSCAVCISFLYALLSEDTTLVVIKELMLSNSQSQSSASSQREICLSSLCNWGTGGDTLEKEEHDGRAGDGPPNVNPEQRGC